MTKLEEVAQALCRRDCGKAWDQYLDDARAAVEALRDPSSAMIEAGAAAPRMPSSDHGWRIDAIHKWLAIIDAILNETGEPK